MYTPIRPTIPNIDDLEIYIGLGGVIIFGGLIGYTIYRIKYNKKRYFNKDINIDFTIYEVEVNTLKTYTIFYF